jgi:hypothetical protein
MHSKDWEEHIRRYVCTDAVLKHLVRNQLGKHRRIAQQPDLTRTLIEQSSRTQAGKWRSYAKVEGVRPDCPSRTDAA